MKLSTGIGFFVLFVISGIALLIVWQEFGPKRISGIVYDCETEKPLAGAEVTLAQQTIFTWDRTHIYSGITNKEGEFDIPFNIGNVVNVKVAKDEYLLAEESGESNIRTRIGLIRRKDTDGYFISTATGGIESKGPSRQCRRYAECTAVEEVNGIESSWNTCDGLPRL